MIKHGNAYILRGSGRHSSCLPLDEFLVVWLDSLSTLISQIGDFGTSRWSHHTNSTGLATYTKAGQTQISLAWSAPEVRLSS